MPTSSADGCMAVARKALRKDGSDFAQTVEQPQKGQPVFAMSYYFDRGTIATSSLGLDHFARISQPCTTPHAPCDVLYGVPMLMGY